MPGHTILLTHDEVSGTRESVVVRVQQQEMSEVQNDSDFDIPKYPKYPHRHRSPIIHRYTSKPALNFR